MDDKKKKAGEVEEEEGQDLCPNCGNLMVDEGGEKVCSSCSEEIDFFGEDEEEIVEHKE